MLGPEALSSLFYHFLLVHLTCLLLMSICIIAGKAVLWVAILIVQSFHKITLHMSVVQLVLVTCTVRIESRREACSTL